MHAMVLFEIVRFFPGTVVLRKSRLLAEAVCLASFTPFSSRSMNLSLTLDSRILKTEDGRLPLETMTLRGI